MGHRSEVEAGENVKNWGGFYALFNFGSLQAPWTLEGSEEMGTVGSGPAQNMFAVSGSGSDALQ